MADLCRTIHRWPAGGRLTVARGTVAEALGELCPKRSARSVQPDLDAPGGQTELIGRLLCVELTNPPEEQHVALRLRKCLETVPQDRVGLLEGSVALGARDLRVQLGLGPTRVRSVELLPVDEELPAAAPRTPRAPTSWERTTISSRRNRTKYA